MSRVFRVGTWTVKEGRDSEFIDIWKQKAKWILEFPSGGIVSEPLLLRSLQRSGHYVSVTEFESPDAIKAYGSHPDLPDIREALSGIAEFEVSSYEPVVRTREDLTV